MLWPLFVRFLNELAWFVLGTHSGPAMSKPNAPRNETSPLELAKAEMEAIFQEGVKLERQGLLDADAKQRIEARLQSVSGRIDQHASDTIAKFNQSHPVRQPVGLWQKVLAILVLLGFVAVPLEFTIGETFVFSYSNAYSAALPFLYAVTLPIFAVWFFLLERKQHLFFNQYPTWAVRWLAMFPLLVVLSSTAVVFAPFGWSALFGWIIGTQSPPIEAKVLSIEPMRERKKIGQCEQKAKLVISDIHANICVQSLMFGPVPKAGDTVTLYGRSSILGVFIEQIRTR